MNKYEWLNELIHIMYPKFQEVVNSRNEELIFIDLGIDLLRVKTADGLTWDSNTECEAFENHFHLFDKVGKKNINLVKRISEAIANNLLNSLSEQFPDKKFIVYLDLNYNDSVIIRFHQKWDNEEEYYEGYRRSNDYQEMIQFKNY